MHVEDVNGDGKAVLISAEELQARLAQLAPRWTRTTATKICSSSACSGAPSWW